ncbi:DNA polymerase Y family protein [Opitutus terrae]|uniref:Nucleotidyltransferase/DNA polymerase involved in DNA repair-like protein n=1 Tax=Opitutus terrae (strain DSM 11246 / JCM 15787 / PB90-1) TaxID=452637 RepID=B1ZZZ2_OPITP|nr:DNA polymerase Y family protein [Opitutus terrae]ACB77328.1 Nucleotidyltransferase/DNA polymerase involved in DNA repair-like protein [Opitutus terrae PB90-1]
MFAVLHLSDFALQAVLRLERELVGRPVGLLDETLRPPAIVACTPEARASGVEAGLTAAQAMARCAGITLRNANPAAETEARAALLAAAFSISPHVEDTAPGVGTMQVGGLAEERRVPALHAAVTQLHGLGLVATAGLAATPLLALYAARFGQYHNSAARVGRGVSPSRELQRLAEDGSPYLLGGSGLPLRNEIVHLAPGTERMFLRDLPLAVAEPLPETAEILAGWGIRTLGELTALTKADVTQRLGPAGLALWERAAGEVTRPLRLIAPTQRFAAELTLEHEVETLEPLLFVLRRFIDRLALELRNAGFVAGELTLTLSLSDETAHARDFRLPEPTAQEEILFRVLHTHLETLHTAATVRGLRLECRPVRPLTRQHGLFDSALRDPHGFAETLGRVAAVVGADRIGTPVVADTHRPDAVTLTVPANVVPPVTREAVHPPGGLPLRRYRTLLRATVELAGAAPAFVWTSTLAGAVQAVAGPWRGSGEWWDGTRRWAREEWDVEFETGGLYRLLRTREGWFVEGEYD